MRVPRLGGKESASDPDLSCSGRGCKTEERKTYIPDPDSLNLENLRPPAWHRSEEDLDHFAA